MSEIQIINAMNQSVINKLTEFKNKQIKKEDLNHFMLVNMCYILKKKEKITAKNDKIKKEQEIEVNSVLSKIKTYNGNFSFNSEKLETKPIMKKLVNQTLDIYIPMSEISYTTEIKMFKEKSVKKKYNESSFFKNIKNIEEDELENEEKELQFEEAPITFNKFTNECDKLKYGDNYQNYSNEKLINLINNSDEDCFNKKEENDEYNTNLFYELIGSFDEGDRDESENDGINSDFKKYKSTFYLDDIFNRRSSKRNSYENYKNFSSFSNSTSIGSNSRSVGGSAFLNKGLYENEFNCYLTYDSFKKNIKQMSVDYLRYMLVVYSNTLTKAKKWFYCEDKMFLNCIKAFILKIGISSKKLYEKIFQSLSITDKNKENIISFDSFLKGFSQILKLKEENIVLKYKFILSLFRLGEEDINVKHINIFMQLLKGEVIFDSDLWDDLNKSLVQRYDRIYPNDPDNNFRFDKMLIVLETFFDKYGKH